MKAPDTLTAGGITAPRGYRAAGIAAGIKAAGRDLALIVSDRPATVAGVFTTNRVVAAPVRLGRERLAGGGGARAIVVNSGCANACTGPEGLEDARRTARLAAALLRVEEREVLVCSTGTIGKPLPMAAIEAGLPRAMAALDPTGGADAAAAILTTDTRPKQAAVALPVAGRTVTVGGMAKGAGMIHPRMATLLVFLTTDAAVAAGDLQACLRAAVDRSFNRMSVDGDRSTNDTALFLANGAAELPALGPGHAAWRGFRGAVGAVCANLARQIVQDGEGATKLVTVAVRGAPGRRAAERVARAVANSLLVKTSWFGADPNWGRVLCAAGYSGAALDPDRVEIAYDGIVAVRDGRPANAPPDALRAVLSRPEFRLEIDLHLGRSTYTMTACDCSPDYVRINAAYMT